MKYVPILMGKQGELKALSCLKPSVKSQITPLFEIPPIPSKWNEGEVDPIPAKSIDAHVIGQASGIFDSWGGDYPVILDGLFIEEEDFLDDNREPFSAILDEARECGLKAIPAVDLDRLSDYVDSIALAVKSDGNGLCLRLRSDDLEDLATLPQRIDSILSVVGVAKSEVDLILDYGAVHEGAESLLRAAVPAQIAALPSVQEWRSLTICASSFPENLSHVPQHSVHESPRVEWMLWTWLYARRSSLARMPQFGDYAIQHPDLQELDPRIIRMSPNARYTGDLKYILAKGEAYRRKKDKKESLPANIQYPKICQKIMAHADWCGEDFSWGDEYIAKCSRGADGPGNATTWRSVGTNHHLTFVAKQLSNLLEP